MLKTLTWGNTQKITKNDSIQEMKNMFPVLTSEGFLQNYRNFYLTVFEIEGGRMDGRTTDGRNITPIKMKLGQVKSVQILIIIMHLASSSHIWSLFAQIHKLNKSKSR